MAILHQSNTTQNPYRTAVGLLPPKLPLAISQHQYPTITKGTFQLRKVPFSNFDCDCFVDYLSCWLHAVQISVGRVIYCCRTLWKTKTRHCHIPPAVILSERSESNRKAVRCFTIAESRAVQKILYNLIFSKRCIKRALLYALIPILYQTICRLHRQDRAKCNLLR